MDKLFKSSCKMMPKPMQDRKVFPKKPPFETTSDYLQSKDATRNMFKLHISGDDISERNVSVTNYYAKQTLSDMERILSEKRTLVTETRKHLDEAWADLHRRETELRQMFIKFNEFVTENHDKRTRAVDRIEELTEIGLKRDAQIEELTAECKELVEIKQIMNQKIISYKTYEDFLNSVVLAYPDKFHSIVDVLNRYEAIKHAGVELLKSQEEGLENLEMFKAELAKIVQKYVVQVMGLQTRVSWLNQRHESARRESQKWEEFLEKVRSEATNRVLEAVYIKDSCWKMYSAICERKGKQPVFKDDVTKQLAVIKKTLKDLRCINEMARTMEREELYVSEKARDSRES